MKNRKGQIMSNKSNKSARRARRMGHNNRPPANLELMDYNKITGMKNHTLASLISIAFSRGR